MQFSLAFLATVATAMAKVAVYELSDNSTPPQGQEVSADVARAYLSDKFGASQSVSLGSAADFINAHHYKPASSQLVISLSGVASPLSFGDEPVLVVNGNGIGQQVAKDMGASHDAHHLSPELTVFSDKADSAVAHFSSFEDQLSAIWKEFTKGQQILVSESTVNGNQEFVTDLAQLLHLQRMSVNDGLVWMNLGSLKSVAKMGEHAVNYAHGVLQEVISQFNDYDVTLIVSDDDTLKLNKRAVESSTLSKRKTDSFDSEQVCRESTGGCSGHGKCVEFNKQWRCACEPTFDKEKRKTTKWAGIDCSKKDVSEVANMFLWTGILLVAFLFGGIKLMFGVGSQQLPGVLQAATNPKKTN